MPQNDPAGYYRGVKSSLLETRPFGATLGDEEVRLRNLFHQLQEQQMLAKQAEAEQQRKAALMSDRSIAQPDELAERMANRRMAIAEPQPSSAPPREPDLPVAKLKLSRTGQEGGYDDAIAGLPALARGIRAQRSAAPVVPGVRSAGERPRRFTTGGLVSMQRDADAIRDPNYETIRAEKERAAQMDPAVLSAQARGEATVEAARTRAAGSGGSDDSHAIETNLARLGSIAMQINQQGGPSGVVAGAIRRNITGPSQTDELAREFEGIRGATALAIAAKLNQGRPTEADRQAAENLLPTSGDSPALVKRKMRLVLQALGARETSSLTDPLTGQTLSLTDEAAEEAGAGGAAVGSVVQYNGKPHRVVRVVNGMAELEPVR